MDRVTQREGNQKSQKFRSKCMTLIVTGEERKCVSVYVCVEAKRRV